MLLTIGNTTSVHQGRKRLRSCPNFFLERLNICLFHVFYDVNRFVTRDIFRCCGIKNLEDLARPQLEASSPESSAPSRK